MLLNTSYLLITAVTVSVFTGTVSSFFCLSVSNFAQKRICMKFSREVGVGAPKIPNLEKQFLGPQSPGVDLTH